MTPQGKTVDADFTPYDYMDKEDLKLFIKLGYPKRQGAGPLNKEELQKMAQSVGVAKLDPEMANAGKRSNQNTEEGRRDYGYDDFGNSLRPGDDEPDQSHLNNYEVQINGKPWKVFPNKQQANKAAATIQMKYGKEAKVYATMKRPSQ